MKYPMMTAIVLMISPLAHATTYHCTTVRDSKAADESYYSVKVVADAGARVGTADVYFHGGFAQFIRLVMNDATVKVLPHVSTTTTFISKEQHFALSVNHLRFQGEVGYPGNLSLNDGTRISLPVTCTIQQ